MSPLRTDRLGKRIVSQTRLRRYELRVQRAINKALDKHHRYAVEQLRAQHTAVTAAAPPDSFGLYSWDTDIDGMVLPELGDVLGDIAAGVGNFLGLPPEMRARVLGEIDVVARAAGFADKVRTISTDIAPRLMEELNIGVAKGESTAALIKRIDDTFATGYNNAERIARTETHGALQSTQHATASAVANAGVEMTKEWLATHDGRTRESHADADGQIVGVEEMFSVGDVETMFPGDSGDPGEDINCRCVAEGTRVAASDLVAVTRRTGKAEFIRVTTTGGNHLAASPEHRVLTLTGWTRTDALVPGDYLVCCASLQRAEARDPYVDNVPPRIEELWQSVVLAAQRREGISPRRMKLDSGGPDDDVDVVRTGDCLSVHLQTTPGQHADEFPFPLAHAQVGPAGGNPSGVGITEPHTVGHTGAARTDAVVREHVSHVIAVDAEVPGDIDLGHAAVEHVYDDFSRGAEGIQMPTRIRSPAIDDSGDAVGIGAHETTPLQLIDPCGITDVRRIAGLLGVHPAEIELDRVLDTFVDSERVQLFDLSTRAGWYVANGIVVHNCDVIYDMPAVGSDADVDMPDEAIE